MKIPALVALACALTATAADVRLNPPKDYDGYFPWSPPATKEAWQARAARVREQLLVSLGLVPLPTRTPLNPVVHGRVERDDYTVERVFFESMPGFFVTGNLYRPKPGVGSVGTDGKRAGVLCPHGHWSDGRFHDAGDENAKKELASGAEPFLESAHSPLQARCVHLARMGSVVFHYDMIGKADSRQIGDEIAHSFSKQRPEMNAATGWGLYSPQAEGWCQSILGLQAWNSIRALDFLESLEDVDPKRLGCTGASGGGTQTFILAAIDPRLITAFPAVMVSTAMQGGCTCENCSGLRVGTGNIEIAALFAPKPMAMTAADDWTKEMEAKGFPQLRDHWTRLGAPQNVALTARLEFGHNYNGVSRAALYAWFNQHLKLALAPDALKERDFKRLTRDEMTVWTADHPAPTGDAVGPAFEKRLLAWWKEDAEKQIAAKPEFAAIGWRVALGRTIEETGSNFGWDGATAQKTDRGDYTEIRGLVVNTTHSEEVATTFLHPKNWNGAVVIWLDGLDAPSPGALAEVQLGKAVVLSRLLKPGVTENPLVKNSRQAACFTFGYNHALFAQRVHDVLTLTQFVRTNEKYPAKSVRLVGFGSMVPVALGARVAADKAINSANIAESDFRFANVTDYKSANFLPGALKYGDVAGLRKTAPRERR
jgi:dienelactone hydrolase